MSDSQFDVAKAINIAILSTSGLLLTIILGFVAPSLRTLNDFAVEATAGAEVCFLCASFSSIINLYSLGKRQRSLPQDSTFGLTIGLFLIRLALLALAAGSLFALSTKFSNSTSFCIRLQVQANH